MKNPSIILFASILTLCTARPAPAVMTEYSTTNRAVTVTNTLPASEVRPLAAYLLFPAPATGTVTIARVTRGVSVPLARHSFTNAAALTWLAPADFPLRRGEALSVSSTVARFTFQLESTTGSDHIERSDAPEWYAEGRPFSQQLAGGGATQVTVTNAPQFVITNNIVVTNAITVNAGAGGPQFEVGPGGEYVATNTLTMSTFGIESLDLSAALNWDGWVDFSGYFAVPAKAQGGSPMRAGEILFDASQGPNGKFYGYRNDTWHAFTMDDEIAGPGTGYIPSLGPWATTNDANAELRFVGGTMNAKIEGTVSGGGTWSMDGNTLALGNLYNAGNGNILIQMGAANEGDLTFTPPSGSVLTLDDTVGSKTAILKGSYDSAGSPIDGFEVTYNKLTLRENFNAGFNPVSIEVDTNGDLKFNDFANTGLLLKNILRWVTAPTASNDPGTAGDTAYDGSFLYVCVATDTWVRTALATW